MIESLAARGQLFLRGIIPASEDMYLPAPVPISLHVTYYFVECPLCSAFERCVALVRACVSVAFRVVNVAGNWLPADYARLTVIGTSIGVFQLRKVREASVLGHNLTRLGNDVVWQRSCCGGFAGWDGGLYFCDGGCSEPRCECDKHVCCSVCVGSRLVMRELWESEFFRYSREFVAWEFQVSSGEFERANHLRHLPSQICCFARGDHDGRIKVRIMCYQGVVPNERA